VIDAALGTRIVAFLAVALGPAEGDGQ
jgi:hypothetical protein